jgi:hypothetical protein
MAGSSRSCWREPEFNTSPYFSVVSLTPRCLLKSYLLSKAQAACQSPLAICASGLPFATDFCPVPNKKSAPRAKRFRPLANPRCLPAHPQQHGHPADRHGTCRAQHTPSPVLSTQHPWPGFRDRSMSFPNIIPTVGHSQWDLLAKSGTFCQFWHFLLLSPFLLTPYDASRSPRCCSHCLGS